MVPLRAEELKLAIFSRKDRFTVISRIRMAQANSYHRPCVDDPKIKKTDRLGRVRLLESGQQPTQIEPLLLGFQFADLTSAAKTLDISSSVA